MGKGTSISGSHLWTGITGSVAQVETLRVRLKYLGRGFLALVFMIGTLAGIAGGFVALLAFRLAGGAN